MLDEVIVDSGAAKGQSLNQLLVHSKNAQKDKDQRSNLKLPLPKYS